MFYAKSKSEQKEKNAAKKEEKTETETENISTCTAYLHFKIPGASPAQGVSSHGKVITENSDWLTDSLSAEPWGELT